ncbi:hypothetical protein [Neisseria sicca]|nr:hypothetical protein [Neisseria sicca]
MASIALTVCFGRNCMTFLIIFYMERSSEKVRAVVLLLWKP